MTDHHPFRIILNDIMDCVVQLNRLTDSEIARATNAKEDNDVNTDMNQRPLHNHWPNLLASHCIDHNYSLLHRVNVCLY